MDEGSLIRDNEDFPIESVSIHALSCGDALFLNILEYFFQTITFDNAFMNASRVNDVFRQEGIGWELTSIHANDVTSYTEEELASGRKRPEHLRKIETIYPQIIHKDGEYIHTQVVRPCLESLRKPELSTANKEMLDAHESYKNGDYAATITKACSALESVFKTICQLKNWEWKPDKDTLTPLVIRCQDKLYPGFYGNVIRETGTIRNRMADSHGRAGQPHTPASQENADHFLQLVSSHINFLVKVAGL